MLRAGLIGYPATGKTTLFQLLTRAPEGHAGRSDAAVGVARVPDERLDRLTALFPPRRRVPATIEVADFAGRAAGAQALLDVAAYRNADALLHVVRAFRDERVAHAAGRVEPARDARAMEEELILADLGVAERRLARLERDLRKGAGGAELRREQEVLESCRVALEQGRPLRALGLEGEAAKRLRGFQFLSGKPLLLVVNIDEADLPRLGRAVALAGLEPFASGPAVGAVAVCAKIELELAELEAADAAGFSAELGLTESGLDRVIRASYDLLGYVTFFTIGDEECRAWSVPRGTTAQAAAGEIHTDIGRGFIRAEVVAFEHLIARGALAACRDHGELRLEGKEYVVADGDVIQFRFAT